MLKNLLSGCAVAALCAAANATVTIDPPGAGVVTTITANEFTVVITWPTNQSADLEVELVGDGNDAIYSVDVNNSSNSARKITLSITGVASVDNVSQVSGNGEL